MGRVLTNQTSLAFAIEASIGVLPGSPTWKRVEPNDITTFGSTITKVARDPISPDRQRRKGVTVDLDSAVEYEADTTADEFKNVIEGFMFANAIYPHVGGADQPPVQSGAAFQNLAAALDPPPAGTDSGYTHDALANPMVTGTLVFARGFTTVGNNGATDVIVGSTTTDTLVSKTLVNETPGNQANAQLEIMGVRGASGDLTWTEATKTLASTVLDFTTLGLSPGQLMHLGGLVSANQFPGGVLFGRIVSVATNAIVLDKTTGTLVADDTGVGIQIDLLFGAFIRNVPVTDVDFLEQFFQWELTMPNLGTGGTTRFEYAIGNQANVLTLAAPLTEKSTFTAAFVGQDTELPVSVQKSGAATPVLPVETVAFGTASNIGRLRILESDGTVVTTCLTDVTIALNNQITGEKCLGTLGPLFLNNGNFLVDIDATVLLTDEALISAVRENRTMSFDLLLKNDDGGIGLDVPALTLGGGEKELPRNESVRIGLTGEAFGDPILGYMASWSLFSALP